MAERADVNSPIAISPPSSKSGPATIEPAMNIKFIVTEKYPKAFGRWASVVDWMYGYEDDTVSKFRAILVHEENHYGNRKWPCKVNLPPSCT
jgi:hypothetical protein